MFNNILLINNIIKDIKDDADELIPSARSKIVLNKDILYLCRSCATLQA